MQKKIEKKRRKNLPEKYLIVSLQSVQKKTLVLQIMVLENSVKNCWKSKEKFCLNTYGSYLCTPIKKLGGEKGQKIFESLETITFYSNIEVRFKRHIINRSQRWFFWKIIDAKWSKLIYNGEFDPGSGWTLAAGLIHASRGAAGVAIPAGDRQTGAEHVRNLPLSGE